MLKYTGHPLVDVGAATIAAFVKKRDLSLITSADLQKVAEYIADIFPTAPFRSYLTMSFTTNAWFIQDAYNPDKDGLSKEERKQRQETRAKWASTHLLQWQEVETSDSDNEKCVYTGEPVASTPLSNKLPKGRAGRAQVPLLLGDEDINFYPGGEIGLPISGIALLCLQAFPLGSARCGKPLAVHSDNPDLIYRFADKFLSDNRREIDMLRGSDVKELSKTSTSAKTALIETLFEIEIARRGEQGEYQHRLYSITAYHLSNSGQGPSLEIYHLPLEITAFLGATFNVLYKTEWDAIVRHAWQTRQPTKTKHPEEKTRGRKAKKDISVKDGNRPRRNSLYEDVFRLPNDVRYFIRRYFLGKSLDSTSWKLTELLMREVMHMDKPLLEEIRQLGDKLGEYVQKTGDKQFYSGFFAENRYDHFRDLLMRANRKRLKSEEAPIITLDEFFGVFESEVEGVPRYDRWKLGRDLVLIRMTEYLHKADRLKEFTDVVPDIQEPESEEGSQE